ncbi:MAG: type II 3-dehydroquinate dehydratase [Candidatus Marinimicrobia bacterium]|nr:type II 3-dehydroquinate dehydratase [Candidatus Neomarinimicrobiota bacterium]
MVILILHGPNMNLIGLRSVKAGTQVTLDKINRAVRKQVRNEEITLKILQTHDEAKAITFLQRNRNSADGLIISPEAWHISAYTLADTLSLVEIPYITVSFARQEKNLFRGIHSVVNPDSIAGYVEALEKMKTYIKARNSKK